MYLVAGLGVTGQSVLRYLDGSNQACLAFDTRKEFNTKDLEKTFPKVSFATGKIPKSWQDKITQIVLSPGIAKSQPWVKEFSQHGIAIIGDIELFARVVKKPVISITGSNGKSTVTTLVGEVLKSSGLQAGVGGNIGLPVLDLLAKDQPDYDVFVLEVSSFQLETTFSLQSVAATVLNISEDHMDRYSSREEYLQTKMTIFNGAKLAVVSEHKPQKNSVQKVINFDLESSECGLQEHNSQKWLMQGTKKIMPVADMSLQGTHHYLNALATIALCSPFNIKAEVYQQVFSRFKGLPHRTQLVLEKSGVQWINDSKGTNVGATVTALESIGKEIQSAGQSKIVLIAGGVSKDADFSELTPVIAKYVRHSILFGKDRAKIAKVLPEKDFTQVKNLQGAMSQALQIVQAGDVVLFSPACASFDQFSNYIIRGEKFEKLVKEQA